VFKVSVLFDERAFLATDTGRYIGKATRRLAKEST